MTEISLVLAVLLFLMSTALSVFYAKGRTQPPLIAWTALVVGLIYGLGWALVIVAVFSGADVHGASWILNNKQYLWLHSVLAFVLLFGVIVGWHSFRGLGEVARGVAARKLNIRGVYLIQVAWALFILSVFLRWLYVQAHGGFLAYLEYGLLIRSGVFDVENSWSFLQPFGGLSLIASYLFWAAREDGRRSAATFIGFFLSFIFSIYVLYSLFGRMSFIVYLAVFALAKGSKGGLSSRAIFLGGLSGSVLVLYSAYWISLAMDLKSADSIFEFAAREVSFPFVSFFAQFETGKYLYRGFIDFAVMPIHFLPSSLTENWFNDVGKVNTLVVSGAVKGKDGVFGAIPVDLLTLGFMQLSAFGVLLVGVLFGGTLRTIEAFVSGIQSLGLKRILLPYVTIKFSMLAVFYAQPSDVILDNFSLIVSLLFISAYGSIAKVKILK